MITAEVDGQKLSDDEIMSTTILLLNAGHEATVHTTGNGVKAILESGLDPKALFAGEAQTAATVEECLRYDAPLHMFTRYALADIELEDGRRFKLGDTIGLMLGAANRDPLRFADADRFDPFRTDGANVIVRRRHPLLHRRAARPDRAAGGAEGAVRAAAQAQACRGAAVPRHVSLPRAGEAGRPVLRRDGATAGSHIPCESFQALPSFP